MHLEGIIWDVDGTLVDSNDLHTRCWQEAFGHFGKHIEYEVVRRQIGKGGDLLVPDLLNAKEMRRFGEEVKSYRSELYKRDYLPRVKPFFDVRGMFERLRERGIVMALASSSNSDEVEYYTRLLGVADLLQASTSKKDAVWSKPSPEIFQAALERLGTRDARTLAVGDTPYDILAAHRVPLAVTAVLSGGFPPELLAKAEFVFDNVQQLEREIEIIDVYFSSE
jgi:HAD superfamily hydrolase (TIGR01549 family)